MSESDQGFYVEAPHAVDTKEAAGSNISTEAASAMLLDLGHKAEK